MGFKKESKREVKKVIKSGYNKPSVKTEEKKIVDVTGIYDILEKKIETKKPKFPTKSEMEERIKKLQNKLSTNQVNQKPKDEDAAKILKWSKNFIVPSLQKLYSKKLVNKENFKDLAKYLSQFCASNRELSDGLKTG